ncbi:MAG: glycerate dehydrogenase [Sinobacteraceae bacterium]|nr:glycerate dehydrogenase [Nevskiaceae bacterium]MCP5470685.1 glycerate dehydrogenase [Nevskiaceae bacterium]
MKAVFLDYETVSAGDLDPAQLLRAVPGLQLLAATRQEDVAARIAGHEIVILNKLQIDRALIAATPTLRLIALAATGTNNVDLEAAREHGVAVCNIRDYCTPSVAQHVLGSILALTHRTIEYSRAAVNGTWARSAQFTVLDWPIRELRGRVLGVIGWGVLGQATARACEAALGMQVRVANRVGAPPQPDRVALHELLPQVDVLTLHCPLTAQTRGMIGAPELALMKHDALIVNTARGALIDLAALAAALRARRIGGAAIDVLPQEPPVDGSPLFAPDLPNLIVTPHVAWAARESRQRCIDEIAANAADFLRGGKRGRAV